MQIAYILYHKEVMIIMVKSADELPVVLSADLPNVTGPQDQLFISLEKAERKL